MHDVLTETGISLSVIIDVLIVSAAAFICALGFYLGCSIRRQEGRIDNLSLIVARHDKEIRELRSKVSGLSTTPGIVRKMRRLFARKKKA